MNPRQRQVLDFVRQNGDTSVQEAGARSEGDDADGPARRAQPRGSGKLVARYHGGVGLRSTVENIDYAERQVMNVESKRRIARLVAQQVESGRSLILNIGTTTEEVARTLAQHRGIRVVTNNLNVAAILAANEQAEVFVAGGWSATGIAASSGKRPSTSSGSSRSTSASSASPASRRRDPARLRLPGSAGRAGNHRAVARGVAGGRPVEVHPQRDGAARSPLGDRPLLHRCPNPRAFDEGPGSGKGAALHRRGGGRPKPHPSAAFAMRRGVGEARPSS